MFVMVIYEYYMGFEINLENFVFFFMKCVFFCRVLKKEVIFIMMFFVFCFQILILILVYSLYIVVQVL